MVKRPSVFGRRYNRGEIMNTMTTYEIINILENEGLTLKYKRIENIPMGRSIHFSFTLPKEELSKEMIKRFGRDFDIYEGDEASFFVTNGTKLTKITARSEDD